jgi:hypothetical protein
MECSSKNIFSITITLILVSLSFYSSISLGFGLLALIGTVIGCQIELMRNPKPASLEQTTKKKKKKKKKKI